MYIGSHTTWKINDGDSKNEEAWAFYEGNVFYDVPGLGTATRLHLNQITLHSINLMEGLILTYAYDYVD